MHQLEISYLSICQLPNVFQIEIYNEYRSFGTRSGLNMKRQVKDH